MTRTRTLIILGIFMLCLAVLAALELRTEDSVLSEGQMVTGSVSKDAPVPDEVAGSPSSEKLAALPSVQTMPSNGGVLVPLDNGTLRGSSASPFGTSNATSSVDPRGSSLPALSAIKNDPDGDDMASSDTPKPSTQQPAPVQTSQAPPQASKAPETPSPKETQEPRVSTQKVEKNTPSPAKPEKNNKPETPKAAAPLVLTADAPDKLVGGQKAITRTRLELGKEIAFRITSAEPLKVKTLLLPDPDRYVVDLQGEWGIEIPRVPKNQILKEIRVGKRDGATRLVFELARKPTAARVNKINPKTFEVRIK